MNLALRLSLFSFLVVSVFTQLSAQVAERVPFNLFAAMPQTEIRNFGIGNMGFDSPTNTYIPRYTENEASNLELSIGLISNIGGKRTEYFPFAPIQSEI